MSSARQRLGRLGEDVAAAQLAAQGWEIVTRNWRTRRGEIDIVARDGAWLVLVEVRARRAAPGAAPEESITGRKQLQMLAMAEAYRAEFPFDGPWRADVVAIEFDARDQVARLAHYRDAINGT
jgi:putative endonuclease